MKSILKQLIQGEVLSVEEATRAFELIMTGQSEPAQTAALLALIEARGAEIDEIIGAAVVMRGKVTAVTVPDGLTVIDTCGTGGDHSGTFNISTAAALVAAGAGQGRNTAVAKHGNRSVTSKSGSSQVLESLGVRLQVGGETLARCLDEAGICFCFAPSHHPAMKFAAPVRAALGFRTIFNVLGPLTNPAGARRQVIGVYSDKLTEPLAEVLLNLGTEQAMVVNGAIVDAGGRVSGRMDEIAVSGPTQISHLKGGQVNTFEFEPGEVDMARRSLVELQVDGPQASADVIRAVLGGETGPARDIVCLNAAAALMVADIASNMQEGVELAAEAIDNGAAKASLDTLVKLTQADQTAPD